MRLGRVGIRVTLYQGRGLAMNLGRVEIRHLRAKDGCYTPTPGELIWARAGQASHPLIQLLNTSGHRGLRSSHAQWLNRVQPLWPHGLQPIRLLCPWDFPGKNTGVGCHFLRGLPSTMNWGSRPMEIGSHLAWTHWLKPPTETAHGSLVWWEKEPSRHQAQANSHTAQRHLGTCESFVLAPVPQGPLKKLQSGEFSLLPSKSFSFCLEFVYDQLEAALKDKPQNRNCVILVTPHPSEMCYLHLNWHCTI